MNCHVKPGDRVRIRYKGQVYDDPIYTVEKVFINAFGNLDCKLITPNISGSASFCVFPQFLELVYTVEGFEV